MQADWMKTRQTKYTAYVTIYILVIVAALGVANWLAQRHNKSIDSTSNKRFSLSDQTEKIVKGLKQDATITLYDQTGSFTTARDLLDRYDNLSTKLHVVYVDPEKKPLAAKAAGIRRLGTVIVEAGGKKEEAKSLTEEEITGALIRTLKTGERNVCFASGSGEHGIEDTGRSGYSTVKEALEKNNYKTRTISLLEGTAAAAPGGAVKTTPEATPAAPIKRQVPSDCTILVVAGPKLDYFEPAVQAVKEYVQGGGRLLIMLDPVLKVGKDPAAVNAGLVKMLDGWGVTVNADLALDTSGIGQLFGFNEVVPLVTRYESHPIVREMRDIPTAFPLTRTLDVKSGDKGTAEKLFSTSANSYATSNLSTPEIRIDPSKDKKGPLTLGVAGSYKGVKEGRFVVVGSSEWAGNSMFRVRNVGNMDLLLNMMNWLSSDEDLISIRPKDPEDRRITLTRKQMMTVRTASIFGLPLLVIGWGLMVWRKRR